MPQITDSEILNLLSESAREAAELYSDNPLDYKGLPVTAQTVRDMGRNQHFADIVKIVLDNIAGGKILDVGIAFGLYDVALNRIFHFDICGVDHPANLKCYCRYPVHKGIQVAPCDVHFQKLPYPDNYFDAVIASEILEHLLISPTVFFNKLHSVLKPGGKLIVTTPNFSSLVNIIRILRCINPAAAFAENETQQGQHALDMRVHPREYTVKEIASSLENACFQISSVRTICNKVNGSSSWKMKMVNRAMRLAPRHRDKIIAIAIKQGTRVSV